MRLEDIPENTIVTLGFRYKELDVEFELGIYAKKLGAIYVPAIKDREIPLKSKDIKEPYIIYKTETGIYEFNELEIELLTTDERFVYEVKSEQTVERKNRRRAFRVDVGKATSVRIIRNNKDDLVVSGVIEDISAVGMAVTLYNEIEIGAKIEIVFEWAGDSHVKLMGTVVRVEKKRENRFVYGCAFDERSETLGRILLKRQLESRRRGLKI